MPWGAVAGVAGNLIVNSMNKDKNGGAGTETNKKEPWAEAAPWLKNLLSQGQSLQQQYTDQPFSEQQKQAYANSYATSDYLRGLVPSLLAQQSGKPGGFDRSNPTAKGSSTWDWGTSGSGTGTSLGGGGGSMTDAAARQAAADEAAKAARAAVQDKSWAWDGKFHSQDDVLTGMNNVGRDASGQVIGKGGFGAWQYGGAATPGTDAYRDMQEYFLRGGADPNNIRAGLSSTGLPWVTAQQSPQVGSW